MVLDAAGVAGVPSLSRFRGIQKEMANVHGVRQHRIEDPAPPTLRVPVEDEMSLVEDTETGRDGSQSQSRKDPLYVNDPRDIVALHWANAYVRPHIDLYPTYSDAKDVSKPLREIWDGEKFDTLPSSALPPMWEHPQSKKHFYVGEMAAERFFLRAWIPLRWLRQAITNAIITEAVPVRFNTERNVRYISTLNLEYDN